MLVLLFFFFLLFAVLGAITEAKGKLLNYVSHKGKQ